MTGAIGVEVDCPFTVGMLKKVTHAAARSSSFVAASEDLQALAEVQVTAKRVARWSERVGRQRVEQLREQAESYQTTPLPQRQRSPVDQVPQLACVMIDGGRIQERDRKAGPRDRRRKGHWKESLVGCCMSMLSQEHAEDPCPTIPKTFADPARMSELSREIKGFGADREAAEEETPESPSPDERAGLPDVLVRSVSATRAGQQEFGQRLVAEAYGRGFNAAASKAFVADGAASNWSLHKKYFSHYTPMLDFTHADCYVYAAAIAGRQAADGWHDYLVWAQWLWEGSIDNLIAAVAARSEEPGPPTEGQENLPAALAAKTFTYLQNQRSRMNYAEYRRLGLPITSSHIESTIKQINRRVKGSEKFWHRGAEPML